MLIHYCVIAFKNIWKYKVSASISILGLAFALVCFVPILYWMDHETTYDSFYKDSESIYRVYKEPRKVSRIAYESKSQLSKPPPRLCFQPKTAEPKRLLISK